MAKETGGLSRLRSLLEHEDLRTRWDAGVLLNQMLGDRAGYGEAKVDGLAKKLDVSPANLANCRRLARLWSPADLKEAERRGVSYRVALKLLDLDSVVERLSGRHEEAVRELRRKLVRAYPGTDSKKLKTWHARLHGELLRVRKGLGKASTVRSLTDVERGVLGDLDRAVGRLKQPGLEWPFGMDGEVKGLLAILSRTREQAVKVFERGVSAAHLLRQGSAPRISRQTKKRKKIKMSGEVDPLS
jgi:hypothetical protein